MKSPFNRFFHPRWSWGKCQRVHSALLIVWHGLPPSATTIRACHDVSVQFWRARLFHQVPVCSVDDALLSEVEAARSFFRDPSSCSEEQLAEDAQALRLYDEQIAWMRREACDREALQERWVARQQERREREIARCAAWREAWEERR